MPILIKTRTLLILFGVCLAACNSDPYRGVYEGIKNQNDSKKTPQDREMTPTPSYDSFKKERDSQTGQ